MRCIVILTLAVVCALSPSAADFKTIGAKAVAAPLAPPRNGRKTVRYARNPCGPGVLYSIVRHRCDKLQYRWDPPVPETYFEVRFSSPQRFTYEGIGSAAVAEVGVTTTHRCSSLMEANALARRVLARMPSPTG